MTVPNPTLIDCTLRDGGYYNAWDFSDTLVREYLAVMSDLPIDFVELGFRSLKNTSFKGAFAFTSDEFLRSLDLPKSLRPCVMINADELGKDAGEIKAKLELLFSDKKSSPVELIRVAAHFKDIETAFFAHDILKGKGYKVGVNLMQIANHNDQQLDTLSGLATKHGPDVLYVADSTGSLTLSRCSEIIQRLRSGWSGALGIHAHDNLGLALANTLAARDAGATWLDSTVLGMGRGPGNAKTEYLLLETRANASAEVLPPLLRMINSQFEPLRDQYKWGTNPFYFMSGKFGIHPTYIQEMLGDARYETEDVLRVIDHLRDKAKEKFSAQLLEAGRNLISGEAEGNFEPAAIMAGRDVLILGSGDGVHRYRPALENFISTARPYVIALNAKQDLDPALVNARAACHPLRLVADAEQYSRLSEPLIAPVAAMPEVSVAKIGKSRIFDFGVGVRDGEFSAASTSCVIPRALAIAYALAIAASGRAQRILLAGFDGYMIDDPRRKEVDHIFELFRRTFGIPIVAITPTKYELDSVSVYGLMRGSA